MKLNYKKQGEGEVLVILHGLFGSLDNWQTLANRFADEGFEVFIIDQRNHGQSPHSEEWNYDIMADDLAELLAENGIEKINLLGHSMGGKTAMRFACKYPHFVAKLMVADIGPKSYPVHHKEIIDALKSVDLLNISSRNDVDEALKKSIPEFGVRQFLIKNFYWKDPVKKIGDWKFNLNVISEKIEEVGKETYPESFFTIPTLFIKGEKSNYIRKEDFEDIHNKFINSEIETIPNAGHWLHAEQPDLFFEKVIDFLK
jgi:pimeloyl-ACP methyl ester carboxylesterase